MKRLISILPLLLLFALTAARVHAQSGCVDSPEDPTLMSGLIAAAAAFGFSRLLKRRASRIAQRNNGESH
jgi:XrtJ-associated TM-motif-TM protein